MVFGWLSCWLDSFIGFELLEFDGFAVDRTDSPRWSGEFMARVRNERYRDSRRDVEEGVMANPARVIGFVDPAVGFEPACLFQ